MQLEITSGERDAAIELLEEQLGPKEAFPDDISSSYGRRYLHLFRLLEKLDELK